MEHEYLNMFLEESQEHLQSLNQNVLVLEKNTEDLGVVGEIFRSAHTFKGMAATMGFTDLANLTHEMENVLDLVRNSKMPVTSAVVDIIFECIDNLEQMVVDIQNGGQGHLNVFRTVAKLKGLQNNPDITVEQMNQEDSEGYDGDTFDTEHATHVVEVMLRNDVLLKSVRAIMVIDALSQLGEVVETIPSSEDIEREEFDLTFKVAISSKHASEDMQKAALSISEIESVKVYDLSQDLSGKATNNTVDGKTSEHVPEPSKSGGKKEVDAKKTTNQTIRVNIDKIEALMNMFEETVVERGRIEEIASQINNPDLNERIERLANVNKELQNIVLNMRMVPVEIVFNRFPRMVRSLAKDLGKSINLIIEGEDTEIDRMVIDEIGDPLVHLIRNSVDHGVETKEERLAAGKDVTGTVRLEAFHSGNNVVIQITDDGKGISRTKVTEKAIKNGLITESESQRLSDNEVYDLLFQPGFSTAEKLSDISGRGVGLDVVKTTITKLGGSLNVKSEEGKGSAFRIELPLTLSIIQSMLVEVNGTRYAMPLGSIIESVRMSASEVHNIQDKYVINYRNKTIQILSLKDTFYKTSTLSTNTNQNVWLQVIIIRSNDVTFAVVVDKIIGQREIVLKSLGQFFKDSNNYFSGATILGDGRVVLIMDVDKIK